MSYIPDPPYQAFGTASNLAAALNSAVTFTNASGFNAVAFRVTVPPAATFQFEASFDEGSNYRTITLRAMSSDGYATSGTASSEYTGSISGASHFRVKVTVAGSGAAGSVIGRATRDVSTLEGIENPAPSVFELNAARGRIQGLLTVNLFARNTDLDIGTEDIWNQGGLWVPPTAARVHNVVSSSVNDTSAGTGARTVTVVGLNASFAITTETVTLNGTTPVATANSYIFLATITVATAGTGGSNAGAITATAQTDATVSIGMAAGKNRSQLGIYQVPAGYTGYVKHFRGSATLGTSSTATLVLELYVRPFGGVDVLTDSMTFQTGGTSSDRHQFYTPLPVTEKGIIKFRGTSDTANMVVDAGADVLLVAN